MNATGFDIEVFHQSHACEEIQSGRQAKRFGCVSFELKVELKADDISGKVSFGKKTFRRNFMTFNSQEIIQDVHGEFEKLLGIVASWGQGLPR